MTVLCDQFADRPFLAVNDIRLVAGYVLIDAVVYNAHDLES